MKGGEECVPDRGNAWESEGQEILFFFTIEMMEFFESLA